VAPSDTSIALIVPEVANDALAVLTGSIDPAAVMLVLTTPCWTVPVSWVVAEAVLLANGLKTRRTATAITTMTAINTVLITTGRENFMWA
jgi:hypothetical protein